jgi:hypothetical protein
VGTCIKFFESQVRAFHELPAGFDIPRVMCAFQRLADDPLPVTVKPSRSGGTLSISSPLVPEAERVFLHCVGSVRIRSSPTKIEADLPIQAQPDIRRLFSALGCDIQELPE